MPTVAAWIWAVAERYAPGDPRPILVELGTAGGGVRGAGHHPKQVIVFASDGSWDGPVCAVASDGNHIVPLLWCGPDGSMAPNLRTGRNLLPGVSCWAIQELNASARFASDHLLHPFRGDSRGEAREGDGSWAGAAGIAHYSAVRDGQWPAGCAPSAGLEMPARGQVAQWVGEAILRGICEWRRDATRHGGTGAGGGRQQAGHRRHCVDRYVAGTRSKLTTSIDFGSAECGWPARVASPPTSSLSDTPNPTCRPE